MLRVLGIPEQKAALRLPCQQTLRLITIHSSPVEGAGSDVEEVGHEAVDVVNLRRKKISKIK